MSSFVVDRRVYFLDQRQSRSRSNSSSGAGSGGTPLSSLTAAAYASPAASPPALLPSLQMGHSASPLPSLPSLQQLSASLSSIVPPFSLSPRTWWASLSSLLSRLSTASSTSSAVPTHPPSSSSSSSYSYYSLPSSSPQPSSSQALSPIEDGEELTFRSEASSSSNDSGEEEEGEDDSDGWEGESDSHTSSDDDFDEESGRSSTRHPRRGDRRRDRRQRKQRPKAQRFSPFWAVCGCPQPCFAPSTLPSASTVYRTGVRSLGRCMSWLQSPERWFGSWSSSALVKDTVSWYKELPSSTREKGLFLLSSSLGTVLFFLLFESFQIVSTYDLEAREGAFTMSYLLAYLISIAWQHALHRLLVFSHQPYCLSLLHTYASYSFSLLCFAALGALLIQRLQWPPRLVAAVTLPCSAVFNYYLLTRLAQCSERWDDAREELRWSAMGDGGSGHSSGSGSRAVTPTCAASDDGGFASLPPVAVSASQSSPRRVASLYQPALPPFFSSAYAAHMTASAPSNSRPSSPYIPSSSSSSAYSHSPPLSFFPSTAGEWNGLSVVVPLSISFTVSPSPSTAAPALSDKVSAVHTVACIPPVLSGVWTGTSVECASAARACMATACVRWRVVLVSAPRRGTAAW